MLPRVPEVDCTHYTRHRLINNQGREEFKHQSAGAGGTHSPVGVLTCQILTPLLLLSKVVARYGGLLVFRLIRLG